MALQKYRFQYGTAPQSRYLVCPQCNSRLQHFDIEEFMKCPYCDYAFSLTPELEEFILTPVVNEWGRHVIPALYDKRNPRN